MHLSLIRTNVPQKTRHRLGSDSMLVQHIKQLLPGLTTSRGGLRPVEKQVGCEWHRLAAFEVFRSKETQKKPAAKGARNVQTLVAQKQTEQQNIANALSSVGFSLSWQSIVESEVHFRELQADPLAGEVAA